MPGLVQQQGLARLVILASGDGMRTGAVQTRHVGNNWVPLLGMSLLFLCCGAVSMVAQRGNGADARIFILATLLLGVLCAAWFWKNPSWWLESRNHYLYLAGGTLLGVMVTAPIPFLHGAGPWLVLGAALIVYGRFEQFRLFITVGAAVACTGLLAVVIHADVWGGALHLLTAAILAFGANKLHELRHGRRRESQDSDPDFIGSFEEFDPNEALRP